MVYFFHGLSSDKGTGNDTLPPIVVVAVRVSVTEGCPIGKPAAEKAKFPCHCPAPMLCKDVIGISLFAPNVSWATLVVVIAEIVIICPFLTTDGDAWTKKICGAALGAA